MYMHSYIWRNIFFPQQRFWPATWSKMITSMFDIPALDEASRAFRFKGLHLVLVVFATLSVVAEAHIGSRVVLGAGVRRQTRTRKARVRRANVVM